MNQSRSACPDPDHLRRVLDNALSEEEWHEVRAHLETCLSCRAQLDRWTEDPKVLAGAPGAGDATAAGSPALDEVLGRLKAEPRAGIADVSRTDPPSETSFGATQECPRGRSRVPTTPE